MQKLIISFTLVFACLSLSAQSGDFESFIMSIEDNQTLVPSMVKDFVKISEIEELEDLSTLDLRDYIRSEKYYGLLIAFQNEKDCEEGYFVTLDPSGMMIDFAKAIDLCEIDLDLKRHATKDGSLRENFVEILTEEEYVLDKSDTSATLDNAETQLNLYYQYFEIQSDGFLLELSSQKEFNIDREFMFASMELLDEEALKGYGRSQLSDIKNEILASYGQIFEAKSTQEYFDALEWYTPIGDASDKLSDVEKRNIALINELILR